MNILPSPQSPDTTPQVSIESPRTSPRWRLLAPLVALLGGVFGIIGAIYTEALHGSLFAAYIGAPIIEESLKPAGVYFLLAKLPHVLKNQLYTAFLTSLGGITFALMENLVYFTIYVPEPSAHLIQWRYTVCIGVHAVCSFIFGLGINHKLVASINGETKFLSYGKRFFFTAMALHSIYNIGATIFENVLGL